MSDHNFSAVVPSISIVNLVNQRAAVIERVAEGLAILREAHQLALAAHVGFPRLKIDEHRYDTGNILADDATKLDADVRKIVDRGAWQYLMNESGLRTFMDAKARREWDEAVEKGQYPDLTQANIETTFEMLYGSRGDMFERGVITVFKQLSWSYKTNRPFAFGKRIVKRFLRYQVTGTRHTALGSPVHESANALDDLLRVLHVLDGKPEPDHRSGAYSLLNGQNHTTDPPIENEYMQIRCFRNGNGHITFKRPDLIEKMNAILAKHFPGALAHDHHQEAA